MSTARLFVQHRYRTLMLLLIAGGFVMLLAELFILRHTDGIQLVAVGASLVGLLLTVAALVVNSQMRNLIAILFLVLSLTGLVGAYEHLEAKEGGEEAATATKVGATHGANFNAAYRYAETQEDAGEAGETGETGESGEAGKTGGENPPPLAPLSLAGFGIMGMVATLGKREE